MKYYRKKYYKPRCYERKNFTLVEKNCTQDELKDQTFKFLIEQSSVGLVSKSFATNLNKKIYYIKPITKGIDYTVSQILAISFQMAQEGIYAASFIGKARSFTRTCRNISNWLTAEVNKTIREKSIRCNKKLFQVYENISKKFNLKLQRKSYKNCSRYLPLKIQAQKIEGEMKNLGRIENPIEKALLKLDINITQSCLQKIENKLKNFDHCVKPLTFPLAVKSIRRSLLSSAAFANCTISKAREYEERLR